MGHDLITIYWLKAVEYVLAVSYLPLFVLFWKFVTPKRAAAVARVPAAAPGWADQLARVLPDAGEAVLPPGPHVGPPRGRRHGDGRHRATSRSSSWARSARFQLPAVGTDAGRRASPALALLDVDGKSVAMLSPVDGTVVAVNDDGRSNRRDASSESPYGDGWLMRVKSPKLGGNLKNLMSGALARRWMDTVVRAASGTEISGRWNWARCTPMAASSSTASRGTWRPTSGTTSRGASS